MTNIAPEPLSEEERAERRLRNAAWLAASQRFAAEKRAEEIARWSAASMEERGRVLADLLRFTSAISNIPPKRTEFPGFARLRRPQN